MKNQTGARYLARKKREKVNREDICVNHVKRESELIRLKTGAVKRKA